MVGGSPLGAKAARDESSGNEPLVFQSLKIPFILLILCFAAWGSAANLSEVLVGVFRNIFTMSNFQSALVTFAYYGAYFALAIPAAFINKRFGYKTGVLTGLGLAAVGGFLFIPASQILIYEVFLIALFVLAAGLSILETSANPFVIAMGPDRTATQRLNLAQAFNPVGANIGVLLGALIILPRLTTDEEKANLSPEQLQATVEEDLGLVLGPYVGIAIVLVLIWLLIFFRRMENPQEAQEHELQGAHPHAHKGVFGRLFRNHHYRYGVLAQFFNVAAQVATWSFTIQYAQDIVGVEERHSGWYLQASLILFLISRFVMTYLLGKFRPTRLLFIMGAAGVALALIAIVFQNIVGLLAVVGISACLSLMFPTIYGVALQGLGEDTKFGAAGLVMAILGGALIPPIQGLVADFTNQAFAFIVTGISLALVTAYALFDLRTSRTEHYDLVSEDVGN
jgi:FHS family L-fucose permease-like MFS transporter